MALINSLALLLAVGLSNAAPTSDIAARQDPDMSIAACKNNICNNCPIAFNTGSGYPQCSHYDTEVLKNNGYPIDSNGEVDVFFSSPELDPDCQILIQTPVTGDLNGGCGGNVLVVQGATCSRVKLDNTFLIQFCCGTGDCTKAGAPTKRSPNPAAFGLSKRTGVETLLMHYKNGTVIPPKPVAPAAVEERSIEKRDCNGFTVTREPYTRAPYNAPQGYVISNEVTCGPTESCSATESKTVEQSFSVDVGVSVSDPFGIVSASVDVTWEQSMSRSFSDTYGFGAGETGYVEFVPILTCVDGYFTGDCGDDGKQVTACAPSADNGKMRGDIRGVIVRGA